MIPSTDLFSWYVGRIINIDQWTGQYLIFSFLCPLPRSILQICLQKQKKTIGYNKFDTNAMLWLENLHNLHND